MPVIDHDVVAVGETAHFFAVASVNCGQIAVAVVGGGNLVTVEVVGLLHLLYIHDAMLRQFINHQDFLLNNLKTHQMISQ